MVGSLPKSLRILCFGDSLTSGFTRMGLEAYPYADHLRVELQHMLSTSDIYVDVEGRPGDQVRGLYLKRLDMRLKTVADAPYDWIIIMGGTNDLGWDQQPTAIYENLSKFTLQEIVAFLDAKEPFAKPFADQAPFSEKIWEVALNTGAKVLGLSIIETAASSAGLVQKRNFLNEMILHHEEDRFFTFDLRSAIQYSTLTEEEQEKIWDDGVHLTAEGYKKMGDAIAASLFEILSGD